MNYMNSGEYNDPNQTRTPYYQLGGSIYVSQYVAASYYPTQITAFNFPTQFPMSITTNHRSNQPVPSVDTSAYTSFNRLILSHKELVSNGFVHIDSQTGRTFVQPIRESWSKWCNSEEKSRACVRCYTPFSVDNPDGECRYHVHKRRFCCGKARPCASGTSHVHNTTQMNELLNFIKTPRVVGQWDSRNFTMYSMDTEMIYTVNGLEVARVTLVNSNGLIVEDIFVKPKGRILDLNTRFSGIRESHLMNAISLGETHQRLFNHINENTILTGHHLSNDLRVLKIIHTKVVDTAVLFKRNDGTYRSLKDLAHKYLKKIIHEENEGHDSAQDARICIELVSRWLPQLVANRRAN